MIAILFKSYQKHHIETLFVLNENRQNNGFSGKIRLKTYFISDVLNEKGISSPSKYCMEKYGVVGKRNNFGLWSVTPVNSSLKNPTYLEHMVQQRYSSISYKNHKRYLKDESEWVVVENTHEAIVTQELWDKVREVERR